ncbi:uncharacterized protein LOC141940007 [Strix uralensis]|uniref:uncharacterized protein LOC141940007 n=2 Tax=Strix uralensis TaxID=36305 RepID=UPI003DA6DCA9
MLMSRPGARVREESVSTAGPLTAVLEWKIEREASDGKLTDIRPEDNDGEDCGKGTKAVDTSASGIAGRKPLTGKSRSRPRPPPPPPPLNILRGDEEPPPPSGAAAAPSGAAAEGVIPSAPPEEENRAGNTEPESESENESEGEEALTTALQTLHITDKPMVKKAQPWTLPPSTVTVIPRSPDRFWEGVRKYAAEAGNWDLVERLSPYSPTPACPKPVDIAAEAYGAFPVYKAVAGTNEHDEHNPISWKVVQDLQNKAQKFGINSPEVMQLIRIISTDLLCPYDVTHLAQVLFQPVQLQVFQSTWRQMARAAAQNNARLPQDDPRLGLGEDALLGEGPFSNPQLQATWPPIVLEQAQHIGITALKRTMEMAAPKQKYIAIRQGPKEPFLQFVEKISAALEKQVEDETLRQMLCKQLAKDNANEDCQKIIQSLPGDPSIPDMVAACSKVGTVEHKMAALATAMNMRNTGKCFGCGKDGHMKVNCPNRRSAGKQPMTVPPGTNCNKCGKSGHFAKQCRSKFHANGQPIQGNHKKSARGRARTSNPLQTTGQIPSVSSYQPQLLAQQGWMYPPPTQ